MPGQSVLQKFYLQPGSRAIHFLLFIYEMAEKKTITIRFYEELNYFLKNLPLKEDIRFTFKGKRSVKDLIEKFGVPHVEVDLILVNCEPVSFDYDVKDRDRISVYPMFERFNISHTSLLRDYSLRNNCFVLDVHLGKLARDLRLLGFDTDYSTRRDDPELAEISSNEHRILLSRDRQLFMRKIVQWGMIIRSDKPFLQLLEVLVRLDLWDEIQPFSRCIACNGTIKKLPTDSLEYRQLEPGIPPGVKEWCKEYNYCTSCRKLYWKGSHYNSLLSRIEHVGLYRMQS